MLATGAQERVLNEDLEGEAIQLIIFQKMFQISDENYDNTRKIITYLSGSNLLEGMLKYLSNWNPISAC